jgi:hypothetical protein
MADSLPFELMWYHMEVAHCSDLDCARQVHTSLYFFFGMANDQPGYTRSAEEHSQAVDDHFFLPYSIS